MKESGGQRKRDLRRLVSALLGRQCSTEATCCNDLAFRLHKGVKHDALPSTENLTSKLESIEIQAVYK